MKVRKWVTLKGQARVPPRERGLVCQVGTLEKVSVLPLHKWEAAWAPQKELETALVLGME